MITSASVAPKDWFESCCEGKQLGAGLVGDWTG